MLQTEDKAVHTSESCFSFQTHYNTQASLLSPVLDDDGDDGFCEPSDVQSHLSVAKSYVADKKSVSCRKRRCGVMDTENLSVVHASMSPTCFVGHETPTSSKQAVKRAKECSADTSRSKNSSSTACSRSASRRLVRCYSEAVIHQALSTSEEQSNLIGDFSRPHTLPLLSSAKHQDLKSICADTVSYHSVLIIVIPCTVVL